MLRSHRIAAARQFSRPLRGMGNSRGWMISQVTGLMKIDLSKLRIARAFNWRATTDVDLHASRRGFYSPTACETREDKPVFWIFDGLDEVDVTRSIAFDNSIWLKGLASRAN